jgi:hypothetical protein
MKTILTALICLGSFFAWAQPRQGDMHSRIQEAKKQFLTEQLALDPSKADAFWKIYDGYEGEKKNLRKQMRALKQGFGAKSDAQLATDIDKYFALKDQEIELEKKYYKRFQEALSIRQIAVLYQSEQKFKQFLLEKMQERRGGGPPPVDDDY